MGKTYIRLKIYSIEEVLAHTVFSAFKSEKEFDGHLIKMNSLRYQTFAKHGTKCANCGLEGKYFAMEKHTTNPGNRYHFNLYGISPEGYEIMLTRDHVIPKSKGGENDVNNMQTLCIRCNQKKGNSV